MLQRLFATSYSPISTRLILEHTSTFVEVGFAIIHTFTLTLLGYLLFGYGT